MCWSKRSFPDFSTVTTTAFTPTGPSTVNDIPVYCHYPAVECSQNATDRYCSFNGKCCERDATPIYCACIDGYTGRYCEDEKLDPWVLESLEANTTVGIAVGVGLFFVLVGVAVLVVFAVIRWQKNRREKESQKQAENLPTDHNCNSKNSTSCEESDTMLPFGIELQQHQVNS